MFRMTSIVRYSPCAHGKKRKKLQQQQHRPWGDSRAFGEKTIKQHVDTIHA